MSKTKKKIIFSSDLVDSLEVPKIKLGGDPTEEMQAATKHYVDSVATTIDSALSSTSTNPVQNKVINNALGGKANIDHGNHVPTPETADNKKFLRNDNSWQEVTPVNIGAVTATKQVGADDPTPVNTINFKIDGTKLTITTT